MARSKKNIKTNEDILLDKDTVWNVLEFARSLASYYPGIITPDLINARMKDISYTPISASETELNRALSDPKNNEMELRSFIENFETISMPLKRIFSYMASHLALDLTYTVKNAEEKDYKPTPSFKRDQDAVYDFLDRFDYRTFFRNVMKQVLRNEVFVAVVRQDGEQMVLQELPLQYCKITGRWDYGLLASFNFYYFMLPGVDISLYPPFFAKKFDQIFGRGRSKPYDPSLPPESRGNSQYVYWVDLPPDVGWAFKLDTSLITAVPYFSGMMPDLINQSLMRNLQKNMNMASASKMILGAVPLLKDTKASVKDMIAIDPTTLGQFLNLVKQSLSESIKVASAPLEDMSAISFDGNDEMYDKYLRTALSSSGMDTALIYASQLKANLIDSQLSFESDSKIMEQQLYPQFNQFMNFFVNKMTKKFKYSFRFEGNDYYLNRGQRFEKANSLADKGIVLPQLFAASLGMKPHELYRMMEESKGSGFVDKLTPILSAFQMSGKDGAGRPQKDDTNLGDSGAQSKESGGNIERGGK